MQSNSLYQLPQIGLLFEASWEVCNKVGGIYTVLSTKARVLHDKLGDRLVFIGPDVWSEDNPSPVFTEYKSLLKSAASKIKLPQGISIRVGRWKIPGSPIVVLVKFDGAYPMLDTVFGEMWDNFGVDSLHSYGDYSEGCAFAVASSIVIKALSEYLKVDSHKVFAHFNEWTTGMGLLYTRLKMPEAATLFTTHATSIGRSICGNGKDLYEYFTGYNGDQMARELNMESKHSLEKQAAHQADCFTAVSDITARECGQLLDIYPQVVTPNGFEPDFVPGTSKFSSLRKSGRKRILEIASALKGKVFSDDTLIVATSGRNEYRNKGLDLYLDSMARLSDILPSSRKVIALVLVPAWVKCPDQGLIQKIAGDISHETAYDFMTHRLNNEDSDAVCCRIRQLENEGRFNDNVCVIYVPCYLDGKDGIVNISYYDFLPALDLSVFASYYEPWGYTPLESIAFGVPTVTSDKSGFGQWILDDFIPGFESCGVDVVERTDRNYNDAVNNIANAIAGYSDYNNAARKNASKEAAATASKGNWEFFITKYYEAFEVADSRRNRRL